MPNPPCPTTIQSTTKIGTTKTRPDEAEIGRCPECRGPIYDLTDRCPACGYWLSEADRRAMWSGASKPKWVLITAAIVLVVLVLGVLTLSLLNRRYAISIEEQMPLTPHTEKHFTASETVRDVVIGMSDGLTVPFALAAGLSGAVDTSVVIIAAGLAEIAAGSIAMGLGGYLAARTDAEHFATEREREQQETVDMPNQEAEEVASIFRSYGLKEDTVQDAVRAIRSDRDRWIDFMMRYELGLEQPDPKRAGISALTIAGSYIVGGLIPLSPYFFVHPVQRALLVSVVVTMVALGIFGYVKGYFTVNKPIRAAWQTIAVGGLAAAAAFTLAKLIG